jgi:hypothetical protein
LPSVPVEAPPSIEPASNVADVLDAALVDAPFPAPRLVPPALEGSVLDGALVVPSLDAAFAAALAAAASTARCLGGGGGRSSTLAAMIGGGFMSGALLAFAPEVDARAGAVLAFGEAFADMGLLVLCGLVTGWVAAGSLEVSLFALAFAVVAGLAEAVFATFAFAALAGAFRLVFAATFGADFGAGFFDEEGLAMRRSRAARA